MMLGTRFPESEKWSLFRVDISSFSGNPRLGSRDFTAANLSTCTMTKPPELWAANAMSKDSRNKASFSIVMFLNNRGFVKLVVVIIKKVWSIWHHRVSGKFNNSQENVKNQHVQLELENIPVRVILSSSFFQYVWYLGLQNVFFTCLGLQTPNRPQSKCSSNMVAKMPVSSDQFRCEEKSFGGRLQ